MKKILLFVAISLLPFIHVFAKHPAGHMNVMTFNIRCSVKADGQNWWEYRKDLAANVIKFYDVDIFGSQEVLHSQLTDLLDRLPGYAYVGVGRTDGKTKGEYSPILYKKDRFSLLKSGNFWISEDINAVGKKGWDAACERIATWAILKDKENGKKFFFLNTHLDHMGQVARHKGAMLILEQANRLSENLPIIITGDFNAVAEADPIQVLTQTSDPRHLTDTRTIAPLRYGPEWSFHNWGQIPLEERNLIDYIFIKGDIKVIRHGILAESQGELYPSDHCPVLCEILIQ